MDKIHVRCLVKFVSKHRHDSILIVREILMNNKVKVQSLNTQEYFVVSVDDVYLI